ncbi:MAG: 50S ribosomal protein L13 [Acidobacteria bacterium]|nr:50S ribosomal protein L13 [Acidobacteriota bacterium]
MKTYFPKDGDVKLGWKLLNAENVVLGRLATVAARILLGKDKPQYTPFLAVGDGVIIVNADKIKVTGKKLTDKKYYHYSGYPGGMKETSLEALFAQSPAKVVEEAIYGMLPKNKLGKQLRTRIKVYTGSDHPHAAQTPEPVALPTRY